MSPRSRLPARSARPLSPDAEGAPGGAAGERRLRTPVPAHVGWARTASPRSSATPYLYSDGEIADLLHAAQGLSGITGLRPCMYATLLALLAVTGMRSSEPLRLNRDDVDLLRGVLTVRKSKFGKPRYIPVHESTRPSRWAPTRRSATAFAPIPAARASSSRNTACQGTTPGQSPASPQGGPLHAERPPTGLHAKVRSDHQPDARFRVRTLAPRGNLTAAERFKTAAVAPATAASSARAWRASERLEMASSTSTTETRRTGDWRTRQRADSASLCVVPQSANRR